MAEPVVTPGMSRIRTCLGCERKLIEVDGPEHYVTTSLGATPYCSVECCPLCKEGEVPRGR